MLLEKMHIGSAQRSQGGGSEGFSDRFAFLDDHRRGDRCLHSFRDHSGPISQTTLLDDTTKSSLTMIAYGIQRDRGLLVCETGGLHRINLRSNSIRPNRVWVGRPRKEGGRIGSI